jgi:single-strand DNA-binding protein
MTEWSKIVFNGKLSEIVDKYVKKGDKILVEGKLRTRKWTDQANVDHYATEIMAREMVMLGSKSDAKPESAVDKYQNREQHAGDEFLNGGKPDEEDDDLPF